MLKEDKRVLAKMLDNPFTSGRCQHHYFIQNIHIFILESKIQQSFTVTVYLKFKFKIHCWLQTWKKSFLFFGYHTHLNNYYVNRNNLLLYRFNTNDCRILKQKKMFHIFLKLTSIPDNEKRIIVITIKQFAYLLPVKFTREQQKAAQDKRVYKNLEDKQGGYRPNKQTTNIHFLRKVMERGEELRLN